MALVHRNAVANMVGGATIAGLTIVITPIQIQILGMEAYAIIGFIATLQVAFTAFDFGLSATVSRELAADQSLNKNISSSLVRTAMTIYWAMAILLGATLIGLAGPIAQSWFNPEVMSAEDLKQSLQVIALYLALRWPVSLYIGVLTGVQKMELLNGVKICAGLFRLVGGVIVLLQWQSLQLFLWWTAASAVVEVIAYDVACRRIRPKIVLGLGFSVTSVKRVWRFSLIMNLLGILAIIIVQLDRLVISRVLSLEQLGHYNLAYTAASVIPLIVAAISSALLPSFSANFGAGINKSELVKQYYEANRFTLLLSSFAAFSLVAYGGPLLKLWVGPENAGDSVLPLAILAIAFWLASVIANAYSVAVARGQPQRYLAANLIIVLPYAALIYFGTYKFGITGTAVAWIVLYLFYFIFIVRKIHRDMLGISTVGWLYKIVLPYALIGFIAIYVPRFISQFYNVSESLLFTVILFTFSSALYVFFGVAITGSLRQFDVFCRLWATIRDR